MAPKLGGKIRLLTSFLWSILYSFLWTLLYNVHVLCLSQTFTHSCDSLLISNSDILVNSIDFKRLLILDDIDIGPRDTVVFISGQKMALGALYVVICKSFCKWSKTLSAPSFSRCWKQLNGKPYSICKHFSFSRKIMNVRNKCWKTPNWLSLIIENVYKYRIDTRYFHWILAELQRLKLTSRFKIGRTK